MEVIRLVHCAVVHFFYLTNFVSRTSAQKWTYFFVTTSFENIDAVVICIM